ncbi:TLC domain-containing protein 2 [Sparganum proliferum]
MRQESNQCVSDFITNLTLAIQDCGYKEIKADNFEHAMLVQQLIVGLRNEKARENILSEKKDLSWEKACDIASHQERVQQNLQQLNQPNDGVIAFLESEMAVSLVNTAVSSPRQRSSAPSKQLPSCYRCGQHHIRWSDCRHQKTVCQFCKKIGHSERVCFSKRRANTNTHATYPNLAEDGEAILRMFSANALLQSPYTITLPVDHHPVKFEIDTGSAVTLINEASLQKLPSPLPASSTFRSYTGQNVEVRGKPIGFCWSADWLRLAPPHPRGLYGVITHLQAGLMFAGLSMEYLGNIMLPPELRKVAVIFASSVIFWLVDTILRILKGKATKQRGSALSIFSEDWEWRNTWLSLIHALITSVFASVIIYRSEDYMANLIGPKDAASVLLVCFSLGYFLHDISHIIRGPPRRHSVEFVLHHVLIIPCFGSAIVLERYVGYAIVSLLVEINSVFLHIRRLLLTLTVSRESLIFSINSSLNFGSALIGNGIEVAN